MTELIKTLIKRVARAFGFQISKAREFPQDAMRSAQSFISFMTLPDNPVCIDVGANNGQTIDVFLTAFESPVIHAFEPSNDLFTDLEKKYERNESVTLVRKGVSAVSGRETFFINRFSTLNSLHRLNNESEQTQGAIVGDEIIDLITLDQYCSENGIASIDVLKIDVQGHEPEVLEGASMLIQSRSIEWIIAEIQFGDMYVTERNDLLRVAHMLEKDYRVFSIVDPTFIGASGALSHADFIFKAKDD